MLGIHIMVDGTAAIGFSIRATDGWGRGTELRTTAPIIIPIISTVQVIVRITVITMVSRVSTELAPTQLLKAEKRQPGPEGLQSLRTM